MAIIKAAKGGRTLRGALVYVAKTAELTSGKDCSDQRDQAFEDMLSTKEFYQKKDGRQYKHYIQSFAPGETTPEQAHGIGQEWAEKTFSGYEVYMGTHATKEPIHNHFIVNSVNWQNGKKLHVSKRDLQHMKDLNDQLCIREGLSIPHVMEQDGQVRSFDQGKYQLLKRIEAGQKVKSYVLDTALAVEKAAAKATGKSNFISLMNDQGYLVSWQDHHKHVTFQDVDGKKVRLANLEKTFKEPRFSKEGLEREFDRLEKASRETRGSATECADLRNAREDIQSQGDRISDEPRHDVAGAIQSKIRSVKARTTRIFENTERDTGRDTGERSKTPGRQPNAKSKHRSRNRNTERSR